MAFPDFQHLSEPEAKRKLLECCHCEAWATFHAGRRASYGSLSELQRAGRESFLALGEREWLEAFAAHPKIGDVNSLRAKYAATKGEAGHEQSGVNGADEATLADLAQLNKEYERKHGFIFIVFATGKSAREMLTILEARIGNPRPLELRNAAEEQAKILSLRMEKLL